MDRERIIETIARGLCGLANPPESLIDSADHSEFVRTEAIGYRPEATAVLAALEANGVRLVDDNRYHEVLRDVEEALEDNIERYASKTFTGKIVAPQYPWIARMMRALHRLRSL